MFPQILLALSAFSALYVAADVAFDSLRRWAWARNPGRFVGARRVMRLRQFNPHRHNSMGR